MAVTPPPGQFQIICTAFSEGLKSTSGECTYTQFTGGGSALWSWAELPNGLGFGFYNAGTDSWATAVNNDVVACSTPTAGSSWTVYKIFDDSENDEFDGTYLIVLATSGPGIAWGAHDDGRLALTSAQLKPTPYMKFVFSQ